MYWPVSRDTTQPTSQCMHRQPAEAPSSASTRTSQLTRRKHTEQAKLAATTSAQSFG